MNAGVIFEEIKGKMENNIEIQNTDGMTYLKTILLI